MKNSGFTLIELLIVIGIVLVLAALLFAGGKRAISSSQASVCMNNMRQIGAANQTYLGDNNYVLPTGKVGDSEGWQGRLAPYLGLDTSNTNVTSAKVLRCPASPARQPRSYRWNQTRNFAYGGTGSQTITQAYPVRIFKVPNLGRAAMLFDIIYTGPAQFELWKNNNNFWGDTYDLTSYPPPDQVGAYPRPHYDNRAVNILYYDGHVAMAKYPLPPGAYYLDEAAQ